MFSLFAHYLVRNLLVLLETSIKRCCKRCARNYYCPARKEINLETLYRLLFICGYLTMVGPPRAATLYQTEMHSNGEMSKQPMFVMVLLELFVRGALLLGIFVALESLVGKHYYELYRLDNLGMLLLGFGVSHTLFSYVFLSLLQPRLGAAGYRLYRLFRNLCYAPWPAIAAVSLVLLWQWAHKEEPFSGEFIWQFSGAVYILMLCASVLEVFIVSRRPLGLDAALDIRGKER